MDFRGVDRSGFRGLRFSQGDDTDVADQRELSRRRAELQSCEHVAEGFASLWPAKPHVRPLVYWVDLLKP